MSKAAISGRKDQKLASKAASFSTELCGKIKPAKITKSNARISINAKHHSKLKALEEEIKLLTSYGLDTVYRLRFDTMKYDYISPSVEKLLGFTSDEMKRVNFRSLLVETRIITDGMRKVESFDELEERRRHGDVVKWQADYLIRTKDGRRIWVSDVSHPWFDKNGNVIGSVGSLRDITDRVETEFKIREELQKLANTDSLTGLPNKSAFFNSLDHELKRINRSEAPIAIMLIEIDRFNLVREKYGIELADKVIAAVSGIIKACLRETDVMARLGGCEFGVVLLESSSKGAYWVAERIRLAVQKQKFSISSDKTPLECSVSVGIADTYPGHNKISSDLYKIAGTRLYIAQNTGRNQVSIDEIMQTH